MYCDHCGMSIPDDAVLCPYCGMTTGDNTPATSYFDPMIGQQELLDAGNTGDTGDAVDSQAMPNTQNGQDAAARGDFSHFGGPRQRPSASYPQTPRLRAPRQPSYPPYKHGYRPVPLPLPSVPLPTQQAGYHPQAMPYQPYASHASYAPYATYGPQPIIVPSKHMKSDNATIVEIILSLFGVFGVGWLLGGETTIGLILLICSFVIYLPVLFVGTIFTLGLGIFCLGPLAIVAIIINAVICHRTLKRREAQYQYLFMQQAVPVSPPVQRQMQ